MLLQELVSIPDVEAAPAAAPEVVTPAAEPAKVAEAAPEKAAEEPVKAAEPVKPAGVAKTDPARVEALRVKMAAERTAREAEIKLKEKALAAQETAQPQLAPLDAVNQRIQALEKEIQKRDAEAATAKQQAAFDKAKTDMQSFVNSSDKYEYTKATGNAELALNLMIQHYNDTGELLSNDEACEAVEENLASVAEKFASTNKLKAKFPTPSSPTLTNRLTQETPARLEVPEKILLTHDERIAAMLETYKKNSAQ